MMSDVFCGIFDLIRYVLYYISLFSKGTFLLEDADVFIITSNRRTFFFPETEKLNFGDLKLLRN